MVSKSFGTLLIQFIQVAVSIVSSIVVTRLTGPDGKGIYTFVTLVALVVTLLAGLGLSPASTYFVARGNQPRTDVASTLLIASASLGVLTVLVMGAVWLIATPSLPTGVESQHVMVLLCAIPALPVFVTAGGIVLGTNRPVAFASIGLCQVGATLLAQIVAVILGATSAWDMLLGWLIGIWVASGLGLLLVVRRLSFRWKLDLVILSLCIRYGAKAYTANVATLLNYRLDSLLISTLASVRSLGYYSVAVSIGEMVWYLANSVSSVLFPHVASVSLEEAGRVTAILCRNTLLISFAGCLALLVGGHYIILILFGSQLLPALSALWLLLPGVLALSAGKVMSSYLSGIGKPIYGSIVAPANLALTIILDVLLIPPFGYNGAAVASSVVYISGTAASVYFFKRESGQSLIKTVMPQLEDLARWRGIARRGLNRARGWQT